MPAPSAPTTPSRQLRGSTTSKCAFSTPATTTKGIRYSLIQLSVTEKVDPSFSYIGVGISEAGVSTDRLPGWDPTSYGYHGDDGKFFLSSGIGLTYGPTYTTGDVVGCGLDFVNGRIFFTKNGENLGE